MFIKTLRLDLNQVTKLTHVKVVFNYRYKRNSTSLQLCGRSSL